MRGRIGLIGLAAWDTIVLQTSYNLTHFIRLDRWEGWGSGIAVITATWLSVSYLAGRYSLKEDGCWVDELKKSIATLTATGAVIAVFIGHSWLYQVVDAQTRYRGFLIPLIIATCFLSTAGQLLISRQKRRRGTWMLIGNEKERKAIVDELARASQDLRNRTTVMSLDLERNDLRNSTVKHSGVAVGDVGADNRQLVNELLKLREGGIKVIPLMGWCEQELQRIPPELLQAEWLVQAEGFGLRPGNTSWRIKRFGDLLGAIALTVITAPLMATGALMVWLEDKGPLFYSQMRTGMNGNQIRIWKLRSMRVDAEKQGAQWAKKADPRITRVGKVLRATRIDELPQLVSVIKGDLSLIGPRPERPEIEEQLEDAIPYYRIRHWVRPGLSGWAQVCYPYGASVADSRMKLSYDIYYIRNATLLMVVLITLKSMRLVLHASGAEPKAERPS